MVVIGIVAGFLYSQLDTDSPEIACTLEAKICPDGTAVGRQGPDCSFAACPAMQDVPEDISEHISSKADLIKLTSPLPLSTTTSPVTIEGVARGYWFFEATFPIVIVNWDGLIIGEGYATAQDEWMTESFVPFTATVSYVLPPDSYSNRGALILQRSNASGLPEHDNALEIPVYLE